MMNDMTLTLPAIAPGTGATRLGWTDLHPYEVIEVRTERKLLVRPMKAELDPTWTPEFIPGGFAGHCVNSREQRWILTSDPTAPVEAIRLRKDGRWYDAYDTCYSVGTARKFHDYNF